MCCKKTSNLLKLQCGARLMDWDTPRKKNNDNLISIVIGIIIVGITLYLGIEGLPNSIQVVVEKFFR
jgi:hypothetical protein